MRPKSLDPRRLAERRRERGLVAVFDLDGTLAPIARTPEEARVPAAARGSLRLLARRPDTSVGVVSGRPLREVVRMIGGARLWLAGIHGWERRAPGGMRERLWTAQAEARARRLAARLAHALAAVPGLRIERKGPIVAVHYRGATAVGRKRARVAAQALLPGDYSTIEGRCVTELRPSEGPTKADAVRWVAASRRGAAVLYAGDDTTDEDAFGALGRGDFPVRVGGAEAKGERWRDGRRRSKARYRLRGPREVARLVLLLARAEPRRVQPAARRKRSRA